MKYPEPQSIKKHFDADEYEQICEYVKDQVQWQLDKTQGIRDELLAKWIKIYKGKPDQEKLTFPWPNASNLVITLAATHADELLSRVMSIYATEQLYTMQIYGDFEEGTGDDERAALEYFLSDVALEPTELDLYRVEETWFASAIRYGTGIVNFPWTSITEKQYVYMPGLSSDGKKYTFQDVTLSEGPNPENVPLNKFMCDPGVASLQDQVFVTRIDTMHWHELRKWQDADVYDFVDQKELEFIKLAPDRNGPALAQLTEEEFKKMSASSAKQASEWDIYECHVKWDANAGGTFSLIIFYHYHTKKVLGGIFNMYPKNMLPLEDAKLAYDDDTYYGYGFMEMLAMYQKEISINHNQRIDNKNLSNTGMGRIDPNSKLASILKLYPGALIPAKEGEIAPLEFGAPNANFSIDDEQLTMQYAASRAGVDPSSGGAGGGTVNAKRGNYSAGGTAIVQQQRDNRNNLRMSDMRSAHSRLGRKALLMYAYFGIDSKAERYGSKAELISKALRDFKNNKLGLMVRPVTASINREMEKQNDILLQQTLERSQAADMNMMQALMGQGIPPELKSYLADTMYAKNVLLKQLLLAFNKRDVDRMAPLPNIVKEIRDAARKQQQQLAAGTSAGPSSTGNAGTQQAQDSTQGVLPGAGGRSVSQLPGSNQGGGSTGTMLPTEANG